MAKKAAKKSGKKAAKKSAKKTAKKASSGAKKAAKKGAKKSAKRGAKKGNPMAPKKVTSGKGATPGEIGKVLMEHVRAMSSPDMELWKKHFHKGFTSIEGTGDSWSGIKAVDAKCKAWMDSHIIHGCECSGPFVGATGFSVIYDMDVEAKDGSMPRMRIKEVGVYTVKNGKVVQEEFMYHCG